MLISEFNFIVAKFHSVYIDIDIKLPCKIQIFILQGSLVFTPVWERSCHSIKVVQTVTATCTCTVYL